LRRRDEGEFRSLPQVQGVNRLDSVKHGHSLGEALVA